MRLKSLTNKILYKRVYCGTSLKDGVLYKRYKKVPRFSAEKKSAPRFGLKLLADRLLRKKAYYGVSKKDDVLYKKYKKVERFSARQKKIFKFFMLLAALLLIVFSIANITKLGILKPENKIDMNPVSYEDVDNFHSETLSSEVPPEFLKELKETNQE